MVDGVVVKHLMYANVCVLLSLRSAGLQQPLNECFRCGEINNIKYDDAKSVNNEPQNK